MNGTTTLQIIDKAPVEIVTREQVEATIAKIRVMVPDAAKMSESELKHIAQESILFRTIPGKDVHYFKNPSSGKLERVEDYKYLISFTENRERIISGDATLKIKYQSQPLTPEEKIREGVGQDDYAVKVIVTTTHDADAFRREVKAWMDLGLNVKDAMTAAREAMNGEIGVTAVGVVRKGDNNIPKGWTPLQKAEKLGIKNAIHKRWGAPTVDELSAYVRGMAKLASGEDWQTVPVDLPAEAQARYADLNAIARDVAERSADMTIEQHEERLVTNVAILRGNNEGTIGEEPTRPDEVWFSRLPTEPITPAEPAQPEQPAKPEPAQSNGNQTNGKLTRPMTPEQVKSAAAVKSARNTKPASETQLDYAASSLSKAVDGNDKKRHSITKYLFGFESLKNATAGQASFIIDWIGAKKENEYAPEPDALKEVEMILRQFLVDAGQVEMTLPEVLTETPDPNDLNAWFPRQEEIDF